MDYKELLKKYISYVQECEGVNFIGDLPKKPPFVDTSFTKEEWEELEKIDWENQKLKWHRKVD